MASFFYTHWNPSASCFPNKGYSSFYYVYFEITGNPCNLISSQQCALFPNRTIFALNRIFFSANEKRTLKQNNQSNCRKMKDKEGHRVANLKLLLPIFAFLKKKSCIWAIKLCDFKKNVIKW